MDKKTSEEAEELIIADDDLIRFSKKDSPAPGQFESKSIKRKNLIYLQNFQAKLLIPPDINISTEVDISKGWKVVNYTNYISNGLTGFNQATGIWSVQNDGWYNLYTLATFQAPLTAPVYDWGNPASPNDNEGWFAIGITIDDTNIYCGNILPVLTPLKTVFISAQRLNVFIPAGTQIYITVLNRSKRNYISVNSDIIIFSVQKVM